VCSTNAPQVEIYLYQPNARTRCSYPVRRQKLGKREVLRELDPKSRQIQERFNNYCIEQSSLIVVLRRHEEGELNMSSEKKVNRLARLRDLSEKLIPRTTRELSEIQR